MKIIDTHSHLNFKAFKDDSSNVMKRTLAEDVWMVNVGTKYETSLKAIEIAQQYERGVYAAIGLHPMYAAAEFVKLKTDPDEGEFLIKEQEFSREKYRDLIVGGKEKIVAMGEIGLDYYYKPKSSAKLQLFKEKQKKVFLEQLELAKEFDLPLILHCRVAHDDLIDILRDHSLLTTNYKLRGIVHCFTGTLEQAQKYIEIGFLIGINGIIFKLDLDNVVKNVPLENMVVETDCPYLTPTPESGKRNEPLFIKHTISKVAELKGVSFDEVCQKTTENAKNLFGI